MTDVRTTQVVTEIWATTSPAMPTTQVAVEVWAPPAVAVSPPAAIVVVMA